MTLAEQRRKRAVTGEFRTFQAIAEVTDGEIADTADVTLNLHTVFITEPGATSPSSAVPFEIIAAVVAAVVIAIFVFVAILLTALYIRMRRRSKMKIRDLHKNDVELERYSRNSGSTTPSQSQNRQTAVFHQQSTITAATLSGSDADDEESIIGEGAAIGYPSQSPASRTRPRSAPPPGEEHLQPCQRFLPGDRSLLEGADRGDIRRKSRTAQRRWIPGEHPLVLYGGRTGGGRRCRHR